MKKNKTIFCLIALMTLLSFSCKKQLKEYNPSGLTAETVFTNAVGFETGVAAAYSYMRFWYGKEESQSVTEMGTDIWTSGVGDVFPQLTQYNNLQGSNTAALTTLWNNSYAAINLCNLGITNLPSIADFTPAQKAAKEAELRFLRAFYYWHVVETWGDVHFTTTPSTGLITIANKTPVDTFYAQIFRDLIFAEANLPATSTQYGRATKPVAQSFLARMYLTRGMNAEANTMARTVIANTSFSLLPRFGDLWNMGNLRNREIIWAVDYSANLVLNDISSPTFPFGHPRGSNNTHLLHLMLYDQVNTNILIRNINDGRPFNRYMPTRAFLQMFDEVNDSRYDESFQNLWRVNRAATGFALNDTAALTSKNVLPTSYITTRPFRVFDLAATYATNGIPIQRRFYPTFKKFKDSTRLVANEPQSARDVFVIRLAEVHLIAAEAQMKLGRADSAAYYVNIIRTRAARPGRVAQMQITAADINIDFLLDERARELAGEQLRWFDLKRTGRLISRVQALNPDAAIFIRPYHTV